MSERVLQLRLSNFKIYVLLNGWIDNRRKSKNHLLVGFSSILRQDLKTKFRIYYLGPFAIFHSTFRRIVNDAKLKCLDFQVRRADRFSTVLPNDWILFLKRDFATVRPKIPAKMIFQDLDDLTKMKKRKQQMVTHGKPHKV